MLNFKRASHYPIKRASHYPTTRLGMKIMELESRKSSLVLAGTEMYRCALEESIREWNQVAQRFRDLDSKAQATATVSGVFIAAAFAFIEQLSIQKEWYVLGIVSIGLFLLASSVVLSVVAMKIRTHRGTPGGKYTLVLIEDVLRAAENGRDIGKLEVGFYVEHATQWQQGAHAIRESNKRKGRTIEVAQWLLVVAILIVAFVIIFSFLNKR